MLAIGHSESGWRAAVQDELWSQYGDTRYAVVDGDVDGVQGGDLTVRVKADRDWYACQVQVLRLVITGRGDGPWAAIVRAEESGDGEVHH